MLFATHIFFCCFVVCYFYIEYFINLIVWFYSRVWLLNKEVNKNPQLAIMILWKFILFLEECWWLIVKCIIWLLFYFNLNWGFSIEFFMMNNPKNMSLPQIEVNSQKIILKLLTNSIYVGTFICDSRHIFINTKLLHYICNCLY